MVRSPLTPSLWPRLAAPLPSSVRSPAILAGAPSGTTMSNPVKMALSPARASSTASCRRITSIDLGREPAGTSSAFSCTLTRCQSTNLHPSLDSVHFMRLAHVALRQMAGVVYRHCCSTSGHSVPHSMHLKLPSSSSGRTSDVRVTVPLNEVSCPMFSALSSRKRCTRGRFMKATQNSLSRPPSHRTISGRCSRTNCCAARRRKGWYL
mmetsp:Transcript_28823/g.71141  ORF Transcript_28823/g.71141 Transcript_28823/m.71141 type:complete len:208 (-) Transcript_28823:131-754(-)